MSDPVKSLHALFATERERIFADLFRYLRFKSISADPACAEEIFRCADWVEGYLRESGLTVQRWEGSGYPTLYASWLGAGEGKPTVLLYGHYDVQPVDPIELWRSPPFEPEIRDGEIYARGAQDDKGQIFYVMALIRALLRRDGSLPVNVKLVIEGEEEVSSKQLAALLPTRVPELKADSLVIVDVGFSEKGKPAVILGARGICALELVLTGSNTDLHSGTNGGVVYNPNRAMVELLSQCVDEQGRVAIPGFYDDVQELTDGERTLLRFDFDPEWYEKLFQAKPTGGERGLSAPERAWARPTFEINGLAGGYSGEGFKTVIPAQASAKISCRLVPNQSPERIFEVVKSFLIAKAPQEMSVEVRYLGGGKAVRSNPNSSIVQAAARAFSEVNHAPCAFTLEGGSIPISTALATAAGAEVVLIGYALPGDQMHAPNEHFGVDRIEKGFVTVGRLLQILAED